MPKSKRAKTVSLTQTRKKGLDLKQKTIDEVKENVDKYERIFVFSVHNMRNTKLKDLRAEWKHSRFYFGKNKVVARSLGQTAMDEYKDNLHKVSKRLFGQMGLLFTNKTTDEVIEFFTHYSEPDFARSGNKATQTVVIQEGPLPAFSHAMEPQLRKLSLPTKLQKGIITLREDFKVCKRGQILNPEQAQILKLFAHMMADFHVTIDSVWQKDGTYEVLRHEQPRASTVDAKSVRIQPRARVEGQDDVSDADLGFEAVVVETDDEDDVNTESNDVTDSLDVDEEGMEDDEESSNED